MAAQSETLQVALLAGKTVALLVVERENLKG
jgi:hypothetical protein